MKMGKKTIRSIIQIIVLITVIVAAGNHYLSSINKEIHWISESVFHYICPICGVTSMYQFLVSSTLWVVKLKSILGIVIGLVVMVTIVFGPIICGYICPFGTIQDLLAKVGQRIFNGKYNSFIPKNVHNKLKYLRYAVLIGTIILTATSSIAILESVNPYHGFLSVFNAKFSITAIAALCVVIILSLLVHRPWCKYLCPYGALLGFFNKIKVFRIVRNEDTCVGCKKCNKKCPMNIDVTSNEEVRDLHCISCLECVGDGVCIKENTIAYTSKDTIQDKNIDKVKTINESNTKLIEGEVNANE